MSNVIEFSVRAIDDFSTTMKSAIGNLSGLEKTFIATSIAATAFTSVRLAKTSLDNAEAMGTAALKANMAVEEYSALAYAASQSNVEAGSLAVGMKMLGRAMAEGVTSDAGKALSSLGVSARDATGELRPTLDVLLDVSDAFALARDDANKTQYAMTLFGRSGVELVPLLSQGSAAITDMMGKAQKLGVVISKDFAASADQVNDNLATLGQVIDGSVNVAMAEMAPVIEQLTGRMIDLATEGDSIAQAGAVMATGMQLATSAFITVIGTVKTLGDLLGGVASALVSLAAGEFSEAFTIIKTTGTDAADNIAGTFREVGKVWDENAIKADQATAKQMASLRNLGVLKEEDKKAAEAQKKAEDALNEARKQATTLVEGQRTPYEQHIAQLAKINELYAANVLSNDAYAQAIDRETAAWEKARVKQEEYKATVTSVTEETSRMLLENYASLGNVVFQQATMYTAAVQQVVRGIGDSIASAVVDGTSLAKMLEAVAKNVAKSVISTLVQIGIQRTILAALDSGATKTLASQKMAAGLAEVYVNAFASTASIPGIGPALAPGVAAAASATAAAGAVAAGGVGAGIGGAFHGGMDYVPAETSYLLDKGERVLSPNQNADLTSFLSEGGSSGGVVIQNLTIHVLENATSADVFARMDKVELRNTLGQPVIDALNEMWKFGITPNFASRKS